jgi:hypothetical protein
MTMTASLSEMRLPGLWTRNEYFPVDDAKGDAEDDAN